MKKTIKTNMRKYFVIKAFSIATLKWSYLKRADADEITFNEDVRWAQFYHVTEQAEKVLETLPQDKDSYYVIEKVYHKF
jgi:hypothetical protein